ncbi:putative RNA-directed DNA polymerase [Rosa chinensis]|uniref:Putative RNA-directed DNA polymerase n=1 Tax=Rosa chinensis TaxID=74649 RepID=A0A2P6SJ26_ROSCH|nr:putative RNA-directed DNA polymerase [Rosa chinensis]
MYLMNRHPTTVVQGMTPIEVWSGRKPNVNHLRVFGSICYAHIPKELRRKLDESSEKSVFMGYSSHTKSYRLYNLKKKKMIICKMFSSVRNHLGGLESRFSLATRCAR